MKTVFVTGIFDLLHVEHVRFLKAAQKAGRVVAGIESDTRTRKLKGAGRPIINQKERKEIVQSLKMVDRAIILPEKFNTSRDYEKIIRKVNPDIYAVSENSPFLSNKRRLCQKLGVEFKVVHKHNPKISTSKIIKKIKPEK